MITIDGRIGEGGGQMIRTSLTLSVLTGQPVHLIHIRANRPNPGLAPQHLTNVRALAAISAARVTGDTLGSTTVTFTPQQPALPGSYRFDVADAARGGSAGAVTLILQTLLLPLALASAPSTLILAGGTHVAWSPSFHYIEHVFLPMLAQLGVTTAVSLNTYGFYPVGGGLMRADIAGGSTPRPISLTERGPLRAIRGAAIAASLPADIAQRMANRAHNVLRDAHLPANILPQRVVSPGRGAGIFLVAEYETAVAGFTGHGKKGLPADKVADAACADLLAYHTTRGAIDPHLADQIMLPLALATGKSVYTVTAVTRHLLTNAWVIGHFLPGSIVVEGQEGEPGTVAIGD